MADVRALLKAKAKERQQEIQHPLAVYNASGQLRCSLCGTLIKFASAWKTHLESKAHKANEAKELERERVKKGKRKVEVEEDVTMEEDPSKKRKVDTPPVEAPPSSNGFPANFFSDPTRKLPERGASDDEGDNDDRDQNRPPAETKSAVDDEWEAFEKALMSTTKPKTAVADIFNQATIFAEPELVDQTPEGFPPSLTSNEQNAKPDAPATFKNSRKPGQEPVKGDEEEEEKEETEFDKQKRKELEEKEMIMDRLVEEERAQEEADDKVRALKARVEALKLQRQARLAKKKAS